MANIDDIAYAIGADKKNPTGIKDWFGRVVSMSPFKVARLGSEIGVECVNLAAASVGDMVYVLKRPDGQHVSIGTVGGGAFPTVLYDNPSGYNGNITLEESVADYDYIRVYFFISRDGTTTYASTDVYEPNGKTVSLFGTRNATYNSRFNYGGATYSISNSTMTLVSSGVADSSGSVAGDWNTYIYRVEAWSGGASIGFGGGSGGGGGGGGGSQIDLLWTNPNPTSAFAAQDVSIPWQNYKFLIVEHYTDTIGDLGSHTEFDTVATNSISDWVFIRAHREVWFMRGVQFPSSGTVHFGSTFYPTTYNSGSFSQTDSYPWVVPTRIWGVKESSGGGTQAADYIVEAGETDGWHWEKWNSGKAEAWATKTHSATINENYGNGWYSSEQHDDIPSGIFTSMEAVTLSGYGSGAGFSIEYGGGQTTTRTCSYWLMRVEGSAQPSTAYISIMAKGRWK